MTFTVRYRDRDGALREECIEAAGRAECMAECRKRGISPMGIVEGRSGRSAASPKGRDGARPSRAGGTGDSKRTTARWVAAAVVLAAIAGGVWWWMAHEGEPKTTSVQQQGEKPKVVKPQGGGERPVPKPVEVATNAVVASTGAVEKVIKTPMGEKRVKVRHSKAVQAALASADTPPIQDLRPPPPDPNAPPPPPPRYKNNLQQQLSEYAWSGRFVGVPDPISNKEARKLVEEPVEFLPDDTPEVRQEKETVAAMQKELKEYMENGGRANDYFMKLMQRQDAEQETIREAKRHIREMCKEGDFELASQAREKFNEYLKSKGLPPVGMTSYIEAARRESAARKAKEGASAPKK